jgi:hypothetical protein
MNYEQISMNNANKKQTQSNPISAQEASILALPILTLAHFARARTFLTSQEQGFYIQKWCSLPSQTPP